MRIATSLMLALMLAACEEDFTAIQQEDTIEAYEGYASRNPGNIYQSQIDSRMEGLYFERAKSTNALADWETYLTKYPEGKNLKDARQGLASVRFDAALAANSVEPWKQFLADFPDATSKQKGKAEGLIKVLEYGKLTFGEPTIDQVNMAEDPKGEKNGWGVRAQVKNEGDLTLEYVDVTLEYLGDDGSVLGRQDWPLVANNWAVPVEDIATKPMRPGESREWRWTVAFDRAPAGWQQKARVYASGLRPVGP